MGSGPLQTKAASSTISSLRVRTLFCFVLFLFVIRSCAASGMSSSCEVDECSRSLEGKHRRMVTVEGDKMETVLGRRRCRTLKRLHHCLKKLQKSCRGNLLFHSLKQMNDKNLAASNCSRKRKTSSTRLSPAFPAKTPYSRIPMTNITSVTTSTPLNHVPIGGSECVYSSRPDFKHCGLFGDPHLRTFSDHFYTCKVEKTWPLIDNDYMVVMVTNVPVDANSSATVTTKITVVIKEARKCSEQRHYVATGTQLPGAFTDGSSVSGSVYILEKDADRHIEIHARFIATTVIIRKIGTYLTFAIQMPSEFIVGLTPKQQLCVQGCPSFQQITSVTQAKKFHEDLDQALPADKQKLSNFSGEVKSNNFQAKFDPKGLKFSTITSPIRFTEQEARAVCKQIFLDEFLASIQNRNKTKYMQHKKGNKTDSIKSKHISSSSEAFSPLPPSTRHKPRRARTRRKRNRMADTRRPEIAVSQSTFNQLQGKVETGSVLPNIPFSHRKKRKEKRKKKSKRHADSANLLNRAKDVYKSSRCNHERYGEENSVFNFYFVSCVFDLMTTGDVIFALAARAALDDVRRTHILKDAAPGTSLEAVQLWEPVKTDHPDCGVSDPQSSLEKDINGKGGSCRPSYSTTTFMCVLISSLYLNFVSLTSFLSSIFTADNTKRKRLETNLVLSRLSQPYRTISYSSVV